MGKSKKIIGHFVSIFLILMIFVINVSKVKAETIIATNSSSYNSLSDATEDSITVNEDTTLELDNQTITATNSAAISVLDGATLTLIIKGENTLKGDTGYAGIYVAPEATLIISEESTGTLFVTGGESASKTKVAAGAAIGGNGQTSDKHNYSNFGTIIINGGTIHATGGLSTTTSYNAGAGIGAGGTSAKFVNSSNYEFSGEIVINGGTIYATGGSTNTGSGSGGAGIGSGAYNQNSLSNSIVITITGGYIDAQGQFLGSGIGGGNEVDSGYITITGGTVLATGSCESLDNTCENIYFGGAGIGGGDGGGVNSIVITGDAVVTAIGQGVAAGIGSGFDASVGSSSGISGTITIGGNSTVTAKGGSNIKSNYGGAAIGSGASDYNNICFGTITIEDSPTIYAYAGKMAQGLGAGSDYKCKEDDIENDISIINIATTAASVYLFTESADVMAFSGQSEDFASLTDSITTVATIIWYTGDTTSNVAYSNDTENIYTWEYADNTLTIYKNGALFYTVADIDSSYVVESWAIIKVAKEITISFAQGGSDYPDVLLPSSVTITAGSTYIPERLNDTDSYTFDGWFLDYDLTKEFVSGTILERDTILYAKWEIKNPQTSDTICVFIAYFGIALSVLILTLKEYLKKAQ